ncbi:hypothetical protein ACLI4Q_10950 [Natrialbaceae archaeon A-CW1-1]
MSANRPPEQSQKVTDEEIIEAICHHDEDELTTAEIEDELPLGTKQTRSRLRELEQEGRVVSTTIARRLIWELDESEPETPLSDSGAEHLRRSKHFLEFADLSYRIGSHLFGVGGLLLLVYLTAEIQGLSFAALTNPLVGISGYAFLAVGATMVGIASVSRLGAVLFRRRALE